MPPAGLRLVLLLLGCFHVHLSVAIGIKGPLPHLPFDIPVPLTTTTIGVDGFIDDEALLTCLDNLLFADANLDLDLESEEYADFIALESNGQLSVRFAELDLEFVAIFYAEACTTCFDLTGDENCCEGDNAHIDLEGSDPDRFYSTVVFICDNVNEQLSIKFPDSPTAAPPDVTESPTLPEESVPPTLAPVTGPPTNSPSDEPTQAPVVTEAPTSSTNEPSAAPVVTESPSSSTTEPSVAPSPGPTTAGPTSLPSVTPSTASPSVQPSTSSPTSQVHPTANPTSTMQPSTSLPTTSPSTLDPTERPSSSPSTQSPSSVPSSVPSQSPSAVPSSLPSVVLSDAPSQSPSQSPSELPSQGPSVVPSISPTINPDLLCVSFSYQLNDIGGGLTAEDILTENGNTLKTGLELAGRNITIQVLNETFPSGDVSVLNQESLDASAHSRVPNGDDSNNLRQHHKMQKRHSHSGQQHYAHERTLEGFHHAMERGVTSTCDAEQSRVILESLVDIWQPRIPSQGDLERRKLFVNRTRRLVFFTDEYPSEVRNVVDFICPPTSPDDVTCVIVEQRACVVLEEGDDPEVVNLALVNGLREAISSGAFEAAIPPEHIP